MAKRAVTRRRQAPVRGRPAGRKSQVTRAGIVRAARVVFSVRGHRATTVTMIAREADLSVGTIYYHFRSVAEIYAVVLADIAGLLGNCMNEVARQSTLRSQLSAWLLAVHRLEFKDRSVIGFLIAAYLDDARETDPDPDRRLMLSAMGSFFATLVHAAIERGELPSGTDERAITALLSSIMWGTGLYSGFVRDADVRSAIARQVDELFSHGLPTSHPEVRTSRVRLG